MNALLAEQGELQEKIDAGEGWELDRQVEIALDELRRIDGILGQLLLLATAGQPDFLRPERVELEPFLEDLLIRWSGVAPRSWRLGPVAPGSVLADPNHPQMRVQRGKGIVGHLGAGG